MRTTALFACAALPLVQGFAPVPSLHKAPSVSSSKIGVVAPEHVEFMNAAVQNFHASSSSNLLADAAAAVADEPEKIGWWAQYLNIFKATLVGVHSTVDGPLRSVGVTQTWGVSIAIFTAGE